jgi:2-methylisocitrate lyase-like PEP mutase family enzyme
MTLLGLPDIGLLSGSEMIDHARRITSAVGIPVIADADTGYGNALNVRHTIRSFEAAGVAGVQLEDQTFPKRCGHFDGTSLIPADEMVGKIKAAIAAREDPEFVVIARTDALAVLGLGAALERARAYALAGADILFVEAPRTLDQLRAIGELPGIPKVVNVVEGGRTPRLSLAEYVALGFRVILYPTVAVRVSAASLEGIYQHLGTHGSSAGFDGGITSFDQRNEINDLGSWLEWEKRFASPAEGAGGP